MRLIFFFFFVVRLIEWINFLSFKFAPTNEKIQHKKLKNLQGQVNEWEDLIKPAIRLLEIEASIFIM